MTTGKNKFLLRYCGWGPSLITNRRSDEKNKAKPEPEKP